MRRLFLLIAFCVLSVALTHAAAQDEVCPQIVEQALASLDETCVDVGRNTACYGNSDVSASFIHAVDHASFTNPSDRIELARLTSIHTSALDESQGKWGLAMLNVQANVPNTMPGQGVIFILMGDAQVNNQVTEAPIIDQQIDIVTRDPANLRTRPDRQAAVVRSVPPGTTLKVDVASPNRKWFRVVSDSVPAWIHQSVIQDVEALTQLPAPDYTKMSPMQTFEFVGGIGQSSCKKSQGSIMVQGPNEMVVDIEVNGVQISIGSTILLDKTAQNELQVTVLSGEANVAGISVPAGMFVKAPLGADNNVSGNFSAPVAITENDLSDLRLFQRVPESVIHYVPDIQLPVIHRGSGSNQPGNGGSPNADDRRQNDDKNKKKDKKDKNKSGGNGHGNGNGNHHDHDDEGDGDDD